MRKAVGNFNSKIPPSQQPIDDSNHKELETDAWSFDSPYGEWANLRTDEIPVEELRMEHLDVSDNGDKINLDFSGILQRDLEDSLNFDLISDNFNGNFVDNGNTHDYQFSPPQEEHQAYQQYEQQYDQEYAQQMALLKPPSIHISPNDFRTPSQISTNSSRSSNGNISISSHNISNNSIGNQSPIMSPTKKELSSEMRQLKKEFKRNPRIIKIHTSYASSPKVVAPGDVTPKVFVQASAVNTTIVQETANPPAPSIQQLTTSPRAQQQEIQPSATSESNTITNTTTLTSGQRLLQQQYQDYLRNYKGNSCDKEGTKNRERTTSDSHSGLSFGGLSTAITAAGSPRAPIQQVSNKQSLPTYQPQLQQQQSQYHKQGPYHQQQRYNNINNNSGNYNNNSYNNRNNNGAFHSNNSGYQNNNYHHQQYNQQQYNNINNNSSGGFNAHSHRNNNFSSNHTTSHINNNYHQNNNNQHQSHSSTSKVSPKPYNAWLTNATNIAKTLPHGKSNSNFFYRVHFKTHVRDFIASPYLNETIEQGNFVITQSTADCEEHLGIVVDVFLLKSFVDIRKRPLVIDFNDDNAVSYILRTASETEKSLLVKKSMDEYNVLETANLIAAHCELPIEIAEVEFQFDRCKLFIEYSTTKSPAEMHAIDFTDFISELYALFHVAIVLRKHNSLFIPKQYAAIALATGQNVAKYTINNSNSNSSSNSFL